MKRVLCGGFAVLCCASLAMAQPGGGQQPGGRGGFQPPPNLFFVALDTDEDGEISAAELQAAATALKTLDKDGDGKISLEESRPPRPARPEGGTGGGFTAEAMITRTMERDTDKDGRISKEEAGDRWERMADNDKNGDGYLDKDEIKAMADAMIARFGQGFQGGRGGRPSGDRPEGGRPEGGRREGGRPQGGNSNRPAPEEL